MKAKQLILTSTAACLIFFLGFAHSGWWPFSDDTLDGDSLAEIDEVTWEDLIPDDFVQPENPFDTMTREQIDKLLDGSEESKAEIARLEELFSYAPVVDSLDGLRVRLGAYVTPLDFDGQTRMSEFLLVPYVGACIHTPPPPANQVVHAIAPESIELQNAYDPVWAVGTLRVKTVVSNLAESGYQLDIEAVVPYGPVTQGDN